ncbi:hypothetical protein X777_04117 [Ooceraea biroi]|uniref:Uncharacterized protein n=1 Tax=Ooceraea biroi TaxID=2015173 RepID=A0A026WIT9_OOCBI|nr:hypothetical protein X777_04117 [Ooceraea biroi]
MLARKRSAAGKATASSGTTTITVSPSIYTCSIFVRMEGRAEKYNNAIRLITMPIKIPASRPRKTHGTNVSNITKKSTSIKI